MAVIEEVAVSLGPGWPPPKTPTSDGTMPHMPCVTGWALWEAVTLAPTPDARSGSPDGAAMSNWIGCGPSVLDWPVMVVVFVGTRNNGSFELIVNGSCDVSPPCGASAVVDMPGRRGSTKYASGAVPVFFTVTCAVLA